MDAGNVYLVPGLIEIIDGPLEFIDVQFVREIHCTHAYKLGAVLCL
jgi:hypothetical protein